MAPRRTVRRTRAAARQINVGVIRVGMPVKKVKVAEEAVVEDALVAAGLRLKETESITLNGVESDLDEVLENNDTIMLTRSIAGGQL